MNKKLKKEQKKQLRSMAHDLKTIIWIGQNGLTENVMEEINTALNHHELIKIKIRAGERTERDEIAESICEQTSAESIQKIGNVIVLYKKNKKVPKIKLP